MAKPTANYLQVALDLRRGLWLIKDPDILMPVVNLFFNRQTPQAELSEYKTQEFSLARDGKTKGAKAGEKRVVVVPIHTSLTKYETCSTYGTTQMAAKILEGIDDESVIGFVLDIDSPGGSSSAIPPLVSAIGKAKAAGKPVLAHCDSCYSAAYWVASQCDAIFADNAINSGFGSIGAYAQILDDREDKQTGYKVITVYAPESKDKNLAYREALEGRPAEMEKELSRLVQQFHGAVKAGRPRLLSEEKGVLTGATFQADEAIRLGLADEMGSLDDCIRNVFIRNEFK